MSSKGRSCGCKGSGSRKSRERFYNSQDFMVNCFKVLPCFKKYRHDWWVCPYAHEGETAKRRDPKKYKYVGVACPDAKQGKTCPRGDDCPCTHNVFEYWLHPTRFRTAFCGRGIHCTRPFCFFAHSLSEMRKPSLDDLLPVIQGDSLFNDEMLKRALEEHKRDVALLGGKDTCSELLDMSFLQIPQNRINPFKDGNTPVQYNLSPRHMMHSSPPSGPASPGSFLGKGSPLKDLSPSPRDLDNRVPNMQSPRDVLGYMNAVLSKTDLRDQSPQSVHYALPDKALGGHSARDLSPSMLHSARDNLSRSMASPHSMSSPLHRGMVAGPPGLVPSPRSFRPDVQRLNLVDHNKTPTRMHSRSEVSADRLSSLFGHSEDASPVSNRSFSQFLSSPVHSPSYMDASPRDIAMSKMHFRQAAGMYDARHHPGLQPVDQCVQSARGSGMHTGRMRTVTRPSRSMSPRAFMMDDAPHSPVVRGLGAAHLAAHSQIPAQKLSTLDSMQSIMSMTSGSSELGRMSSAGVTGSNTSSTVAHPKRTEPEDGCDIPESLQAVLRSLAREDDGMLEQDYHIGLNRPFSSISKLW